MIKFIVILFLLLQVIHAQNDNTTTLKPEPTPATVPTTAAAATTTKTPEPTPETVPTTTTTKPAQDPTHKPDPKPSPKPVSSGTYNCTELHDHPDQLKIIGVHKDNLILMATFTSAFNVSVDNIGDSYVSLPVNDSLLEVIYPKLWANPRFQKELPEFSSGLITDKQLLLFVHGGNHSKGLAFDFDKGPVTDGFEFPADVIPISTSSKKFYGIKNGPQVVTIANYLVESEVINSTTSDMPLCLVNDSSIVILAEGECQSSSFKGAKPFQEKIFAGFVYKNQFYLIGQHVYKFSANCTKHHPTKLERFTVKNFIDCANNSLLLWLIFLLLVVLLLICCISLFCCRGGKNLEQDKPEAWPDCDDRSSLDSIKNQKPPSKPKIATKPKEKSKSKKTKKSGGRGGGGGGGTSKSKKSKSSPKKKSGGSGGGGGKGGSKKSKPKSKPKSKSKSKSKSWPVNKSDPKTEPKPKSDDIPEKTTPNFATAAGTKDQPKSKLV